MAFNAQLTIRRTSQTTLEVVDSSDYSGLTTASFTARTITLTDFSGATPSGFSATIPFPFVNGKNDLLVLTFNEDLAFNITLSFTPVTPDATATFTVQNLTYFLGHSKAMSASRVHKCEIQKLVKTGYVIKYRDTNLIVATMIDNVDFLCQVGDLESAQGIINKLKSLDTETISLD